MTVRIFDSGKYRDATEEEIELLKKSIPDGYSVFLTPEDQAISFVRSMAAASTTLTDTVALSIPDLLPTWDEVLSSGNKLEKDQCITKDGRCYRVVQAITPQAHQVPGGDGMLAIYRPIDRNHKGTLTDPIPWVNGMDCCAGMYYSYHEAVYLCNGDMKPCVWAPDTAGLWQWSKMEGEQVCD